MKFPSSFFVSYTFFVFHFHEIKFIQIGLNIACLYRCTHCYCLFEMGKNLKVFSFVCLLIAVCCYTVHIVMKRKRFKIRAHFCLPFIDAIALEGSTRPSAQASPSVPVVCLHSVYAFRCIAILFSSIYRQSPACSPFVNA